MVSIEKTNKPDSFAALYQLANPGPNARPKVPLLDAKLLHTIPPPSSATATAGGTTPITKREPETERIVLCESTVITEFLVQQQQEQQQQQQVQQQQQEGDENHRPALLLPDDPQERAKIRLFLELCGNAFNSYVPFLRVQNEEQLQEEYTRLQDQMKQVDAFLLVAGASSSTQSTTGEGPFVLGSQFTLAEIHLAPFVQRCCEELPAPYDPFSIGEQLHLTSVLDWMQALLTRDSVMITASSSEMSIRRQKLINRLGRIQNNNNNKKKNIHRA